MMNDTYVTVVGNVVEDPRYFATASGVHLASIRLASTSRRFDKEEGRWRDGDTLFLNVACWRSLGDNVAASVKKGDPLVVSGRLRMRSYTNKDGLKRVTPEIDANAIGHNLSRGIAYFQKPKSLRSATRNATDESDDPWTSPSIGEGNDLSGGPGGSASEHYMVPSFADESNTAGPNAALAEEAEASRSPGEPFAVQHDSLEDAQPLSAPEDVPPSPQDTDASPRTTARLQPAGEQTAA